MSKEQEIALQKTLRALEQAMKTGGTPEVSSVERDGDMIHIFGANGGLIASVPENFVEEVDKTHLKAKTTEQRPTSD